MIKRIFLILSTTRTPETTVKIDRQKTCPFLIKMYCRIDGHHRLEEFAPPRFPVDDEIIVHTWRDATLRELSLLVRAVMGDLPNGVKASDPAIKFSFKLLYPDPNHQGTFISRPLGWALEGGITEEISRLGIVDASARTLESLRFMPGDFIDVAIYANPAMIPKQAIPAQRPKFNSSRRGYNRY